MRVTNFYRQCALAFAVACGSTAVAATPYSSRPTYITAAGPATATENFSSFTADASFQTVPVAVNGYTLQQFGTATFRNLIDATPFAFTDNNGTSHASCATGIANDGVTNTGVVISFPSAVKAFGGDFYDVEGALAAGGGAEGLRVLLFNGATQIAAFNVPDQAGAGAQFFGVVAGAGEQFTSIRLTSRVAVVGASEGFGLDDTLVTVPEPASAALLLLPVAAMGRRRISRPRVAR